MRIGIDIDNCISNFDDALFSEYLKHDKELRNTGVINKNAKNLRKGMFDWTEEEENSFYHENIENIAKKLKTIEGAAYYIQKLKEDGHEIYIITGRNNGEYSNPYELTFNWLHAHQIVYDHLILTDAYDKHAKTIVCLENNIDIMIDDSIKIILDLIDHGIKVLTMNTRYNQEEQSLDRVSSWKEIYTRISKLDQKKSKVRLSSIAKVLILDQSIGKIISIFLDVFLAAYFYKISQQNILYLSVYNIVGWLFATIGAVFVADMVKHKNKVKIYNFGTLIKAIYIFMIMVLGEKIVDYIYIIGTMYGISIATTGFPYNMIESESISEKERSKYIGFATVATEIISLIIPILLGAYITLESYQFAASLIFIFSILKLILSLKIKNKNVQNSKVDVKKFYSIFCKDAMLKKIYIIEFFKGVNRYGIMGLVVSLLIIYQSNNELELGSWTSLLSIFTIVAMYLFGKFYKESIKRKLLVYSLGAILIGSLSVLYQMNLLTAIIYNIAYYVFMNIIFKITEVHLYDYSNQEPFATKYNTEYFLFREFFLNAGRILGYTALLFLVGFTQNMENLKIIFVLIICSIIATVYFSWTVKNEIKEEK